MLGFGITTQARHSYFSDSLSYLCFFFGICLVWGYCLCVHIHTTAVPGTTNLTKRTL